MSNHIAKVWLIVDNTQNVFELMKKAVLCNMVQADAGGFF